MIDFNTLVYKLGSLHSLLRDLEAAGLYQGEHTVVYSGADGTQQTVHVYVDGTDLQMYSTAGNESGLSVNGEVTDNDELPSN